MAKNKNMKLQKQRNPLFNHPLMSKSHCHEKSKKARRRAEKIALKREWYSQTAIQGVLIAV